MPTYRYRLKDGTPVPGVTTVLSRFKESGGLIHWAWKLGMEGKDYRKVRDAAAQSGTEAHELVERWIRGEKVEAPQILTSTEERAYKSFGAFLEWAQQSRLTVTRTEVALVSEKHRFGGCLDAIIVNGKRAVGDWKTSNRLYPEYLIQVAAYGLLWEENFPDEPITGGYHLVRFDKEHGDFTHRWWGDLAEAVKAFIAMRALYDTMKVLETRAA